MAGARPGEIFPPRDPEPECVHIRCAPAWMHRQDKGSTMEFLNFLIILLAAWTIWRRPEKERFAFGLLVASCILMTLLFLIGTHGSLVPGVNL